MTQPSLFQSEAELRAGRDICAGRHRGNVESRAAFERARGEIREMHRLILNYFAENGEMTAKEVAVVFGKPFNQISGRFSELKQKGYLVPTGRRRDGSAVLRLRRP